MNKSIYINGRFLTQRMSGVQRCAYELSKGLLNNENIQILTPKSGKKAVYNGLISTKSIGFFSGYFWEQIELPLFLFFKQKPLLLNFCNTAPILYFNKLVYIHDVAFLHRPQWFSNYFYLVYKFLIPNIIRSSRAIITVSNFSATEIKKYFGNLFGKRRIHTIYNGIESCVPIKKSKKKDYFLAVSSIDPRKNFEFLLKVWGEFDINTKLVIVGSCNSNFGSENNYLSHSDNIEFTGYVSEARLEELYKDASIFIYPSLYEGFGIPPLEAMSHGVPVILSDIPVFKEVFEDCCLYGDPTNITDFGKLILSLQQNKVLKDELIEKGYKKAKSMLWKDSVRELKNVIKKYTE